MYDFESFDETMKCLHVSTYVPHVMVVGSELGPIAKTEITGTAIVFWFYGSTRLYVVQIKF